MTCNNGNEMLLVPKEKVDDCIAGMTRFLQSIIDNKRRYDAASIAYIDNSLFCMLQFGLINRDTYNDITELHSRALDSRIDLEMDMTL